MNNDFATISIEKHEKVKQVLPDEKKKIFIISPVRKATNEDKDFLYEYANTLEYDGYEVHLPMRDTIQDQSGIEICEQNRKALAESEEVHLYYKPNSKGSIFDLGMVFALKKKLVLINEVNEVKGKSFSNVILNYSK